ncbi:MAG TPA: hypothetical protein VKY29_01190 [Cryomorphaceae bacterium]|nr:hypothetical protein [Cryomorphaceae bacterium]
MVELSKHVLQKVSFDRELFKKELRKSLRWIKPEERVPFKAWCMATFGSIYHDVIADVFDTTFSASL